MLLLVVLLALVQARAGGALLPSVPVPVQYTHPLTGRPVPQHYVTGAGGLRYGLLPCDCLEYGCGCCAGISMSYFNWSRTACLNITYDPYDFAFGVNLLMDDQSIFKNSISGKNPPPACVPVPLPLPILPPLDFCVKFFNVFTPPPGVNLHMCLNFETRVSRAPVLVLEFDCVRMGSAGVYLLKPEDYGEIPEPETESPEGETQEGEDTYDETTPKTLYQKRIFEFYVECCYKCFKNNGKRDHMPILKKEFRLQV